MYYDYLRHYAPANAKIAIKAKSYTVHFNHGCVYKIFHPDVPLSVIAFSPSK